MRSSDHRYHSLTPPPQHLYPPTIILHHSRPSPRPFFTYLSSSSFLSSSSSSFSFRRRYFCIRRSFFPQRVSVSKIVLRGISQSCVVVLIVIFVVVSLARRGCFLKFPTSDLFRTGRFSVQVSRLPCALSFDDVLHQLVGLELFLSLLFFPPRHPSSLAGSAATLGRTLRVRNVQLLHYSTTSCRPLHLARFLPPFPVAEDFDWTPTSCCAGQLHHIRLNRDSRYPQRPRDLPPTFCLTRPASIVAFRPPANHTSDNKRHNRLTATDQSATVTATERGTSRDIRVHHG